MLGPALDAVTAWVTGRPSARDNVFSHSTGAAAGSGLAGEYTDADHFGNSNEGPTSTGDLVNLLSNLTVGLWAGLTGAGSAKVSSGATRAAGGLGAAKPRPVDTCSGVILHLFVDSPQVLRSEPQSDCLLCSLPIYCCCRL
jgi:hypothetical protein